MREPYCPLSSAVCNATIPTLPLFEMAESACSPFCYVLRFAAVANYNFTGGGGGGGKRGKSKKIFKTAKMSDFKVCPKAQHGKIS